MELLEIGGFWIRCVWLDARRRAKVSENGKGKIENGGRVGASALTVCVFFVPGHLDAFEFAFVREFGIAGEIGERANPFVEIGEAYSEGIDVGVFFGKLDADFFYVVPVESWGHGFGASLEFCGGNGNPLFEHLR
jgi:hypothetical protein